MLYNWNESSLLRSRLDFSLPIYNPTITVDTVFLHSIKKIEHQNVYWSSHCIDNLALNVGPIIVSFIHSPTSICSSIKSLIVTIGSWAQLISISLGLSVPPSKSLSAVGNSFQMTDWIDERRDNRKGHWPDFRTCIAIVTSSLNTSSSKLLKKLAPILCSCRSSMRQREDLCIQLQIIFL